jgi:hypothetical protein
MIRVDQTRPVDEQTTKSRYETHMTSGTAYQAITKVIYKQLQAASLVRPPQ